MGNNFNMSAASSPAGIAVDLGGVRKDFVRAVGRHDLILNADFTTNTDNGADRFIMSGQRFLDRRFCGHLGLARHMEALAVGDYQVTVERLISVKAIHIVESGEKRTDITKNFLAWDAFRREYSAEISAWDSGKPTTWTHNIIGLAPGQHSETSGSFTTAGVLDFPDITFGDGHFSNNAIMFAPKADATYTIDILGKFYSPRMSANTDTSFWTLNEPELLVSAAAYMYERTMRNSAGQNQWLTDIRVQEDRLDNETVDFELSAVVDDIENWEF